MPSPNVATKPTAVESTKKTADIFSAARQLYNARKRLFAKAEQLMTDADPRARALCESIEEEEAGQPIAVTPAAAE